MPQDIINTLKTSKIIKNDNDKYGDIIQALENIRIELDTDLSLEFFKDFK